MTPFATVVEQIDRTGLTLVRAHPRADRLHLDMLAGAERVIGQWVADPAEAERVARATARVAPDLVERRGAHLVVHHGGADRRLAPLAQLVDAGAELVVHRPERRAVVRTEPTPCGSVWSKVVRPGRTADLVRRTRAAAAVPGLSAPDVTSWDEESGTIRLTTLPGTPLHDLLPETVAPQTAQGVGRAVRTLHEAAAAAPVGTASHDLASEVDVTRGLLGLARTHAALGAREAAVVEREIAAAAARVVDAGRPAVPALLHRDLHDKQLLVDGDAVGMLDVDTLALGDPALDLGNLLAHLDLRVLQGRTSASTATSVEEGVLAGYGPDARTLAAARGYRALTTARLRALYAFRPGDLPPSA